MKRGRISSWSVTYGFIRDEETDTDVFFCRRSMAPHQDFEQLRHGDLVSFDLVPDPKHPGRVMAGNVAWVAGAEPSLRMLDWRAKNVVELRERQRARGRKEAA